MNINVYDSITIEESVFFVDTGIQILINDVPYTKSIRRNSLNIENILTRQVDRAKFTLKKYGSTHTFEPEAGQEVRIYNDRVKIFAGLIIKIEQRAEDYKIILFDIEVEDYTRLLNKKLVVDTFENQTIGNIIASIASNYLSDFTTNNVKGVDKNVSYIAFNYLPVAQCLEQLADLINYDWYVDYDKDIHFFSKTEETAPFNLSDSDGSYIFSSLKIRRDNSQLRNVIYIRGGEYLADTFTTEFISDGNQNVYSLPYRYDELQVSVTGEIWSQGIDGRDPITVNDYIWNSIEKFIRFRGDRIPNDTSSIRISGQPYLPVRVVTEDEDSINSMKTIEGGDGRYEYLVIDNSINSREGARERADVELEGYKDTISEASFRTYTSGLSAGQRIRINSSAHGVDEYFIINKVSAVMRTEEDLVYSVSLVTTKTLGIIEFLQSLLVKDVNKIVINAEEILDLVYNKRETITIDESIDTNVNYNDVYDSLTAEEVVAERELDYMTTFVAGPWIPTDTRRVFILNGSPLGPLFKKELSDQIILTESITVTIS